MIWRVRDRASFDALARVPPVRRGALWLRSARVGAPDTPPRVAYAIGRPVGNSVQRNRARRRMRAAVREASAGLEPGRAYLFGAGREAVTMPYREVVAIVEQLLSSTREAG